MNFLLEGAVLHLWHDGSRWEAFYSSAKPQLCLDTAVPIRTEPEVPVICDRPEQNMQHDEVIWQVSSSSFIGTRKNVLSHHDASGNSFLTNLPRNSIGYQPELLFFQSKVSQCHFTA